MIIILFRSFMPDEDIPIPKDKNISSQAIIKNIKENEDYTELNVITDDDLNILLYIKDSSGLTAAAPGNHISFNGFIKQFNKATNYGEFDASKYYHNKGILYSVTVSDYNVDDTDSYSIKKYLYVFSKHLEQGYKSVLNKSDSSMICGIVLGKRYLISEDDSALYKRNGIMHILAISGMHISIISLLVLWLFSKLPVGYNTTRLTAATILILYGIMAGFSVSTIRAVVMILLNLAANICGRKYDFLNGVSLAGILILLMDPVQLFSVSFALSFIAVAGIFISENMLENSIKNEIVKGLLQSMMITLFSSPILLYYYNDVPLYSFLINLVILPLMTLLFILALVCGLFSLISLGFAGFFAGAIHYLLRLYEYICTFADDILSGLRLSGHISITTLIVCYGMILIFFLIIKYNKKVKFNKAFLALLFICVISAMYYARPSGFVLTMIDVGQGDGFFMRSDNNRSIVIDCGSSDKTNLSKSILEPYFNYEGIKEIDIWIISHMDNDHVSGLKELLERNKINKLKINNLLVSTYISEEDMEYFKKYNNIIKNIITIERGYEISVSERFHLKCLSPGPENESLYNDANNSSLVIDLTYDKFKALFTGDISKEVEEELVKSCHMETYDLLKISHHGSHTGTYDELLKTIKPSWAFISAGKNNRYGHPHKDTINRLISNNIDIYRTDISGAITISNDIGIRSYNT